MVLTKETYLTVANQTIKGEKGTYTYRCLGSKEADTLLMLPHLSATMDNWDPVLMDELAKTFRVITFDNLGVGASSGDVQESISAMAGGVLDFANALSLDTFHLLGMSMGGMVAQEFMTLAPERVDKLILAGTGPRGGEGIDKVTRITWIDMLRAVLYRTDPKRFLFFENTKAGKDQADAFLKRLSQRQTPKDEAIRLVSFRKQLRAIHAWGRAQKADLSKIKHATLVLNGDHDRMVPTPNSYDLAKRLPNAHLKIYPQAGHGAIFQYPRKVATDITDFILT